MKFMLSFAALAVTSLALQSLPVKAQDNSTSSSGSTSSSSTSSGSSSRSSTGSSTSGTSSNSQQQRTNQRLNSTTNNSIPITFNSVDPAGANGANGSNGGGSNGGGNGGGSAGSNTPGGPTGQPYYGQSDVTIRTTPTVYAPPVSGGNPCTLAVSGGLSVIGWGAAAGGTFVDKDCADRQKIAMIHNAGYAKAAQELMCNDRATYMAFRGTDKPCNPRPEFDGPGGPSPPMVQPVPLQPAPQQQVIVKDRSNLPRCGSRVGGVVVTDNCFSG